MPRREETRIVPVGGVNRVWGWGNGHRAPSLDPARQQRPRANGRDGGPNSLTLRFHHFKGVHWVLSGGPMAEAYVAVVVHDGCQGCLVCGRTTEWFMEFARLAYRLTRMNLRDCMHWGHLFDNPKPLIVPTSNLRRCNLNNVAALRKKYFSLCESVRPHLREIWPPDQCLSQSERFEDRLTIVTRMVELWEDGQYIGWPS